MIHKALDKLSFVRYYKVMKTHKRVKISSDKGKDGFTFKDVMGLLFISLAAVVMGCGVIAFIVAMLTVALEHFNG